MIEEEYQIIDPQTRELRSYITEILEEGRLILREQIKPELHQSIVEVGTEVCQHAGRGARRTGPAARRASSSWPARTG